MPKKKLPLIVALTILAAFVGAYLFIPKSYSIYQEAMDLARNDAVVREALGNDIDDGLFVYSRVSRGHAKFEIPLTGTNGEGLLIVTGEKIDTQWTLQYVLFESEPGARRHAVFKI